MFLGLIMYVYMYVCVKGSCLKFVGAESGSGNEGSTNGSEVGWFILSEDQQHIGPYAVSELRG